MKIFQNKFGNINNYVVKYVQVDCRIFVMYNTVRLYFSGKFDVEKYGLGNKKLQNGFNNNKLKYIYGGNGKTIKK